MAPPVRLSGRLSKRFNASFPTDFTVTLKIQTFRRPAVLSQYLMKNIFIFSCIIVIGLCGCRKQQQQEYAGVEGDTVTGTPLAQRQEGVSFFGNNVNRSQFQPVYFAFDSFEIQSSEAEKLRQIANFMKGASNNIILAGFTDERGTEEYNRGLGERRAQAARNYLISLGVSSGRIQTVSFGLEMPADPGHNESAWAKNRRVETGVVR
jgi:peptidoglycan-associated lipoprotein